MNMSQVIEVRRKNLRLLIERRFDGSQKNFSLSTGISPSQLGQWLSEGESSGTRNMSERSARRLEVRLSLPAGWLDVDHDGPASSAVIAGVSMVSSTWPFTVSPEEINRLSGDDRELVDRLIKRLLT